MIEMILVQLTYKLTKIQGLKIEEKRFNGELLDDMFRGSHKTYNSSGSVNTSLFIDKDRIGKINDKILNTVREKGFQLSIYTPLENLEETKIQMKEEVKKFLFNTYRQTFIDEIDKKIEEMNSYLKE